jgi:hypothetical protein
LAALVRSEEEFNPELAIDDRISRRASIARHHSQLERSR